MGLRAATSFFPVGPLEELRRVGGPRVRSAEALLRALGFRFAWQGRAELCSDGSEARSTKPAPSWQWGRAPCRLHLGLGSRSYGT